MEEKITCRNCGREIDAEDKFCPGCGAVTRLNFKQDPKKTYCHFCGAEIPDDALVCPICGTGVTEEAEEIQSRMRIGEERYLSDEEADERAAKRTRTARASRGRRSGGNGPIIIGALVTVAILALLYFLSPLAGERQLTKVFSRNDEETASVAEEAPENASIVETVTNTPTATPTASATPTPTLTATVTPTPTATPTETATPTPTPEVVTPEQTSEVQQIMSEAPAAAGAVASNGYIVADSNSRLLSESELDGRSAREIRLIANEIYARRGYTFTKKEYADYFAQFDWYNPTVPAGQFDDSMLSATEKANVDMIQAYEKAHGINQGMY